MKIITTIKLIAYISTSILRHLNGFDTTSLDGGEATLILSNQQYLNKLKKQTTPFEIKSMYFDYQSNKNEVFSTYKAAIVNEEHLVVTLTEKQSTSLNRTVITNLFNFASALEVNNFMIILNRKNKEYGKIFNFTFISKTPPRTFNCRIQNRKSKPQICNRNF